MKVGTIVKEIHQLNSYPKTDNKRVEHTFYQLRDGRFKVLDQQQYYQTFKGQHFVCLGSTYYHGIKDSICGFELLDSMHEIVTEVPKDLKP